MTFCALVIGLVLGIFITRNILMQLGGEPAVIADIAQKIAAGDLTMNLDSGKKQDVGAFAAMKAMTQKLRDVVSDVMSAGSNVASGSEQLSSSSQEMSQGATEQAAAAEELHLQWSRWFQILSRTLTTPCRQKRYPRRRQRTRRKAARPLRKRSLR